MDDKSGPPSKSSDPDAEEVYESMEPLEPYTTGELASRFEAMKDTLRKLLDFLIGEDLIRKKELESGPTIWIREPPKHECPKCRKEFKVKYFHPVFQTVQYCPECGTRIRE